MSEVVKLTYPEKSIAVVSMEDRDYRNTFSPALIHGLSEVFEQIQNDFTTKVVVIHGYGNYFCCGGTKEELLNLFEGKARFDDLKFYRLLLDCKVPTIAAMQGHALGGGLAFGCYADIIILAEEFVYSTNFMKYGFTPGLGSTYIVPRKFGPVLGHEMMFTAKNYYGHELKERGVSAKVVSKTDVIALAIGLAREIADKTLVSLKLLKQHSTHEIRSKLPEIVQQELAMHEACFSLPEVRERIEKLFGT